MVLDRENLRKLEMLNNKKVMDYVYEAIDLCKQYCSANIAVLCDGSVAPCATIREKNAPNLYRDGSLYDIFQTHRDYLIFKQLKSGELISEDCKKCKINDQCWGCRSRAFAAGLGIYGRDPRCFTQIAGERNK
jgi:radical SAM protein with 4Fe4S-binding SPASM domain